MCSRSNRKKKTKQKENVFIKLCTQPDIPKPTTELASFQDRRGLPKRRLGFGPQQNCRSHYAAIICCREMTLTELSALHTKKTTTNKQRQAALIIFRISRESGQRNSFELDVRNKCILNSQNKRTTVYWHWGSVVYVPPEQERKLVPVSSHSWNEFPAQGPVVWEEHVLVTFLRLEYVVVTLTLHCLL